MHIVCPHCTTSYAIDPSTLGVAGRTVRCSRCKEVWLARPEDAARAETLLPAMAAAGEKAAGANLAAEWDALAQDDGGPDRTQHQTPVIDSPSIASGWPDAAHEEASQLSAESDWASAARREGPHGRAPAPLRTPWFWRLLRLPALHGPPGKPLVSLPTYCAAMGALVLALMIWRVEVVRLLPQTAMFYKMVGLDVNLRGLAFKDVKITTETVEGKSILVIEGAITGETSRPVEVPRLRFSVRDAQGAEIYAWNTALEQAVLKPGERALFKSRLASPPPEGRNIELRFFSKRDIAGGNI